MDSDLSSPICSDASFAFMEEISRELVSYDILWTVEISANRYLQPLTGLRQTSVLYFPVRMKMLDNPDKLLLVSF